MDMNREPTRFGCVLFSVQASAINIHTGPANNLMSANFHPKTPCTLIKPNSMNDLSSGHWIAFSVWNKRNEVNGIPVPVRSVYQASSLHNPLHLASGFHAGRGFSPAGFFTGR
jgi:hypothetical protein